ncbi:MAG: ABC transporter substrate-binding protein [Synergistaceae bacterium]|jgi:peptide/nickel transport system substrate-binding protein|nr:ABC transporter substrate-binding protein [Synergistaceae bacterium]
MRKMFFVCLAVVLAAGAVLRASAAEAAPKEFVVGIPKITDSFAFFTTTNGYETFSMAQVYDTLVTKDENGRTVPMLAEKFEMSDDAKTYTFYLRKGVKFSNGKELKANDVRYSIEQLMTSAFTSWIYEPLIDKIELTDDYTVKLRLKKTSVSFIEYLSNAYYSAILSEEAAKEFGDKYGTTPETVVGTGPYVLKEWKFGEYCVYEANESYYLGAPSIKRARLKVISDVNAAIIALQTGEIHAFFDDIPGLFYDQIASAKNVKLASFPSTILFTSFMNCRGGIFADRGMREAVAYATDRSMMLIVGAEGKGAVADYPGNRQGYTEGDPVLKDAWTYQPDMGKAKKLVEEAGMAGKSVLIKTYATDPYPKLATILQQSLTQAGLAAEVRQMERSAFIDEVLGKGDFEIQICRWAAAGKDIDEILAGSLHTDSIGAPGNWSFYSSKEMDSLLDAAAAETDPGKRREIYTNVVKLYVKDIPAIPFYYPNGSRAYSDAVKAKDSMVEYNKFYDYAWVE